MLEVFELRQHLLGVQTRASDKTACFSSIGAKGTVTKMIGSRILHHLVAGTKISLKRIDPTWRQL